MKFIFYMQISLSHDEHFDYEVKNLKKGKQRGVTKKKKGKHNSKRGKKHGDVNSNEQKEVNNSLVLTIFIAFYRLFEFLDVFHSQL